MNKYLKVPLYIHALYILTTLFINLFGPKEYLAYDNKVGMIIFILFYLLAVILGFSYGCQKKCFVFPKTKKNNDYQMLKLTVKCLKIACFLYLVNTIYMASIGRFSINLSSMGANYNNFYSYYVDKTETSLFTFENVFLITVAIPQFIGLCLGFFYFKRFSSKEKFYFVLLILFIVTNSTISNGNQKSIGDIIIFLFIILGYNLVIYPEKRNKIKKRIIFITISFIGLMAFSQFGRYSGHYSGHYVASLNDNMPYARYNPDNIIFKVFGEKYGLGLSSFLCGYLSDGYYGLSKSLELPFVWTYGIGNSVGLSTIVEKSLGVDIYEQTYLGRMEKEYSLIGISGKRNWHSIFPWLASDITFPGVIILFFFVGYLYAVVWKETIQYRNSVSYLMFSLLTIMFIFIPCNNQIFHGYNYIMITSFVFIYWLHKHKLNNCER